MVYGAIGYNYKSKLVFIDTIVDAGVYIKNLLDSGMFEDLNDREYIFMQDGAPSHTATKVKNRLHSSIVIY